MIDMGASIYSMVGYGQFLAYQKYNPDTSINNRTKKQLIYNLVLALFHL